MKKEVFCDEVVLKYKGKEIWKRKFAFVSINETCDLGLSINVTLKDVWKVRK